MRQLLCLVAGSPEFRSLQIPLATQKQQSFPTWRGAQSPWGHSRTSRKTGPACQGKAPDARQLACVRGSHLTFRSAYTVTKAFTETKNCPVSRVASTGYRKHSSAGSLRSRAAVREEAHSGANRCLGRTDCKRTLASPLRD